MFAFASFYEPSPLSWEVVSNTMSSFWKFHHYEKLCSSWAVSNLLSNLTYTQWYTKLPSVHLLHGSSQRFTWFCHQIQGINLVVICLILTVWHINMKNDPNLFLPYCRLWILFSRRDLAVFLGGWCVPAQDVPFNLIIWYVSKTIYFIYEYYQFMIQISYVSLDLFLLFVR